MSEYNIQMNKYNALNAEYDQLYPQPMKHASTHAKDGDDPITPSSIGAAELGADGKVLTSQLPSMEVDAYTKVQTLSDTTKTLFGLDATAVPDDAMALLSRFHKGLGNEYVWDKIKVNQEFNPGIFTDVLLSQIPNNPSGTVAWVYSNTSDMSNPTTINISYDTYTDANVLAGKFFKRSDWDKIFYGNPSGSATRKINGLSYETYFPASENYGYRDVVIHYGYVNSPDPNAYPTAVPDGYTYTPLGQLGEKGRLATGSYTGTGTYGSSNPNSLTFDFEPKMIIVSASSVSFHQPNSILWFTGVTRMDGYMGNASKENMSLVNNVFSWSAKDASYQLNSSGGTYYYIAIG